MVDVFQYDQDMALGQSQAQKYSSSGRSDPVNIHMLCQMMHIAHYRFVY